MAHTITIKYTGVVAPVATPAAPICPVMQPTNCAADMPAFDGTYYDTNVEGWGAGTSLEQFIAQQVAHPGLVAALKKAVRDGEYTIEDADEKTMLYLDEVAEAIADQGFVVDIKKKVEPKTSEVSVDGKTYPTLAEAISAAASGGVVTLVDDTGSTGVKVAEKSDVTIDLNGHSLILSAPNVGSPGTETLGFQLLKGSNVTFKNGTIVAGDAKMVIQNYSNLVLDNVVVEGGDICLYLLSNNFGNTVLKNGTKLIASGKTVAFDLYYGMAATYDEGVTVTIEDNSVVVKGAIEYGKADRAKEEDFVAKCKLTTPVGYKLNIPAGYEWSDNGDGTQTLVAIAAN